MMLSDGARGEKGSQRIRIHTDFSENLPCMLPQSRRRESGGQAVTIQRYRTGDLRERPNHMVYRTDHVQRLCARMTVYLCQIKDERVGHTVIVK